MEMKDKIFEKLLESVLESKELPYLLLKELDYNIIGATPDYNAFQAVDIDSKKIEILFKTYILGILEDDKELRIKSMSALHHCFKEIPEVLKRFRKGYLEAKKKDCENEE